MTFQGRHRRLDLREFLSDEMTVFQLLLRFAQFFVFPTAAICLASCNLFEDFDSRVQSVDSSSDAGSTDTRDASSSREFRPLTDSTFDGFSAGSAHTCVLAEGSVECFGDDTDGQASPPDQPDFDAEQVAAGGRHTCARNHQEIRCWGANARGQLGLGATLENPENQPVQWDRMSPDTVFEIRAGLDFSVALHSELDGEAPADMRVAAWGDNRFRQTRPGFSDFDELQEAQPSAAQLDLVSGDFREVSAGARHTCALDRSGNLKCWGDNTSGQLGFEPCQPQDSECSTGGARVFEISGDFRAVAAGGEHTCALTETETWCWGNPDISRPDDPEGSSSQGSPRVVATPVRLSKLGRSLGATQCGISEDAQVVCWGLNSAGQASTRHEEFFIEPTVVDLPESAIAVESGVAHTCAQFTEGHVRCWGDDDQGQLGELSLFEGRRHD